MNFLSLVLCGSDRGVPPYNKDLVETGRECWLRHKTTGAGYRKEYLYRKYENINTGNTVWWQVRGNHCGVDRLVSPDGEVVNGSDDNRPRKGSVGGFPGDLYPPPRPHWGDQSLPDKRE